MIQCSKWNKIFENSNWRSLNDGYNSDNNITDYKNLVLRDNIFKISHLQNMESTIKKIKIVSETLQQHIEHECS